MTANKGTQADMKQRLFDLAVHDMEQLEIAMKDHLRPNLDLVADIASHLLFSGGKRLRPLLMIHGARICGYDKGDEVSFSVLFEYLHAATLLHDDVVDEAAMRRSKVAAHHKWPPAKVILTGDFLLARALEIAADTGSCPLVSVIAAVTNAMSQGEIDQMHQAGRLDIDEDRYRRIIEGKTAVLIEGACRSGAILAGAESKKEKALQTFGHHLGMAFQMADDLLDYTATAEQLGKNPGADLREGKMTIPFIKALEHAEIREKEFLTSMMGREDVSSEEFQKVANMIAHLGGISYTEKLAEDHAATAKKALDVFDDGNSKEFLTLMADYTIKRKI